MPELLVIHGPWMALTAAGMAALSLVALYVTIVLVRSDVLVRERHEAGRPHGQLAFRRHLARVLRLGAGSVLVLMGVFLSLPLVPGPGLLMILIGLAVLGIVGKKRLASWLGRFPRLLHVVNALRRHWGRAPLRLSAHG